MLHKFYTLPIANNLTMKRKALSNVSIENGSDLYEDIFCNMQEGGGSVTNRPNRQPRKFVGSGCDSEVPNGSDRIGMDNSSEEGKVLVEGEEGFVHKGHISDDNDPSSEKNMKTNIGKGSNGNDEIAAIRR